VSAGFDRERLAAALARGGPGRVLEMLDEAESTQDLAFALAEGGATDGSVVLADRQTRGRGRLGRGWDSPAGMGIWFSAVLRPGRKPPPSPPLLVAATALAVAEGVERAAGLVPSIRWPNDLMAGDRKLGGILLETRDYRPAAPLFVLGVGLNACQGEADFPEALRAEATSLARETGRVPDRTAVLTAVLEALDRWRGTLDGGESAVEEAYRARAAYLGRRVSVLDGAEPVTGVLESASPVAGLFLRLEDGGWRAVRPEHARDLRPA
jgi:BirA family biotin operon repressor/biotin-[acetyl-CoA-carboxylase] ligase